MTRPTTASSSHSASASEPTAHVDLHGPALRGRPVARPGSGRPAGPCARTVVDVLVAFAVIGVVLVAVVGLLALGSVTRRLAAEPGRGVFEGDEALAFVAEALPSWDTAELSYDEVARIMRLHLDVLHARGVARSGGDLDLDGGPVVLDPDTVVAEIVTRAGRVAFFPDPAHVADVVAAQLAYFEAIGVVDPVLEPELADLADLDRPTGGTEGDR